MDDDEAIRRLVSMATSMHTQQYVGWAEKLALQRVIRMARKWQDIKALARADSVGS